MTRKELVNLICRKATEKVMSYGDDTDYEECFTEYMEQFELGIHNKYLRVWVTSLVEGHSREGRELLKLIIKYNLMEVDDCEA